MNIIKFQINNQIMCISVQKKKKKKEKMENKANIQICMCLNQLSDLTELLSWFPIHRLRICLIVYFTLMQA